MKKKYIYWFLGIMAFLLIVLAVFAWLLFYTEMSYHITVSKETTYYTKPLLPDGRVDYVAVINEISSRGVTPENNGFIPFARAVGFHFWCDGQEEAIDRCYELLGILPGDLESPPDYPTLVRFNEVYEDYHEELKTAWENTPEDARTGESFDPDMEIYDEIQAQKEHVMAEPWSAETYPLFARWTEKNERPLTDISEAMKYSHWFIPLSQTDGWELYDRYGDIYNIFSNVSRCLATRTMHRIEREEIDAAWDDILTNKRLARHVASMPSSAYIAHVLEQKTFAATVAVLADPALKVARRREMIAELNKLGPLPPIKDDFEVFTRIETLYKVQCIPRRDWGDESDRLLRAKCNVIRRRMNWDQILEESNAYIDRYAAALDLPNRSAQLLEIDTISSKIKTNRNEFKGDPSLLKLFFTPNLTQYLHGGFTERTIEGLKNTLDHKYQNDTHRRIIEIACRLAAYRDIHREYPDSLDAIMDETLNPGPAEADLLIDPFAETERFHYRKNPDGTTGYFLYSIGENEIDEAGRWDDPYNYDLSTYRDDIAIRIGPQGYVPPSVWNVDPPEEDGESDNSDGGC